MQKVRKYHSSSFKAKVALSALKDKKTMGELSQEFHVAGSQIHTWKKQIEDNAASLFETKATTNHKDEIDRLHRIIGQIEAERDFLARALRN